MKRFLNIIVLLSTALFFAAPLNATAANILQANPGLVIPGLAGLAYGTYMQVKDVLISPFVFHAVEKEIWTSWIMDNLFKGVEFLKNCFRADEFVLQGKVVHIPQAGAAPAVVKNRSSLPATVVKRTDTDVNYSLDEFSTDPTLIPQADKVQLSYDKMSSVLGDHIGALNEVVADNILISWSPSQAANIIRTTGSSYAAHTTAATGNRKGLSLADLKKAKTTLDKQKVAKMDRYALISSDMFDQLEDEVKATSTRDYSRVTDPTKGEIIMLYGFQIIVVPVGMPVYNNAGTPAVKAYGAAGATSDNEAVLCYQKNALELALGEIKFFENTDDPTYYGDVYSALVYAGGRKRRSDEKGIVAIVQAAA